MPTTKTTTRTTVRKARAAARGKASSGARAKSREGKKAIVGYFSPTLSKRIQRIALEEEVSMQAIVGEALDLLLAARGQEPAGER